MLSVQNLNDLINAHVSAQAKRRPDSSNAESMWLHLAADGGMRVEVAPTSKH